MVGLTEKKRFTRNNWAFIISYAFMGLVSGAAFDILVTYLQMVDVNTANAFSMFMGLATFICAAVTLLIPKLGYKKLIITGPLMVIAALLAINYINGVEVVYPLSTLAILTGVTLFDVVLPPFISAYTNEENRNKMFSRTLYINVAGMAIATFIGGYLAVWIFSQRLGISYDQASVITENIKAMTQTQANQFMLAQKDALMFFIFITILSLIPLFFIREKRIDYIEETPVHEDGMVKEKSKFNWAVFKDKYVLIWLLYFGMIRFGASLIVPYFSVYLSNTLGISRGTTSLLVGLTNIAMVVFMVFSPYLIKKFGKVITLGGLGLLSIPFMFFIAQGNWFTGSFMMFGTKIGMKVLVVGIALFMRAGLMNAGNPVTQQLPMEFVSKNMRPAYNSVIFVAGGLTSIIAGIFTSGFLFKLDGGYSIAYYITMVMYAIASFIVIKVYYKRYNSPDVAEPVDEDVDIEKAYVEEDDL